MVYTSKRKRFLTNYFMKIQHFSFLWPQERSFGQRWEKGNFFIPVLFYSKPLSCRFIEQNRKQGLYRPVLFISLVLNLKKPSLAWCPLLESGEEKKRTSRYFTVLSLETSKLYNTHIQDQWRGLEMSSNKIRVNSDLLHSSCGTNDIFLQDLREEVCFTNSNEFALSFIRVKLILLFWYSLDLFTHLTNHSWSKNYEHRNIWRVCQDYRRKMVIKFPIPYLDIPHRYFEIMVRNNSFFVPHFPM